MSRQDFGLWGIGLSDEEFAQALAALSVLLEHVGFSAIDNPAVLENLFLELWRPAQEAGAYTLPCSASLIDLPIGRSVLNGLASAELYRDAWRRFRRTHQPLRLEVRDGPPGVWGPTPNLLWLARELGRPEVCDTVYVRQDEPTVPVEWNWPLRVGLLRDALSSTLRQELEHSPFAHLFQLVEPEAGVTCDVLLLPQTLRGAVESVLGSTRTIEADCVIVTGGDASAPPQAERLIQLLRTELRTSGVAVLHVPRESRLEWFERLVFELSINQPIDRALNEASRSLKLRAPLLVASRSLIEATLLSRYVERLGTHLLRHTPEDSRVFVPKDIAAKLRLPEGEQALRDAARRLRGNAEGGGYPRETDEAASIAEFKRLVEESLGDPLHLAPVETVPPPERNEPVDRRAVKARFLEHDHIIDALEPDDERPYGDAFQEFGDEDVLEVEPPPLKGPRPPVDTLRPSSSYLLQVRIGLPELGFTLASEEFPVRRLPPSSGGHSLSIAFCELPRGGPAPSRPQLATIHLPVEGESSFCLFHVRTRDAAIPLVARLIVLHENRVLQTLLLTASVVSEGEQGPTALTLEPETVVRPGFDKLDGRRHFDATLVLNHSPDGTPGVTTIAGGRVSFLEPEGLRQELDALRVVLNQVTDLPDTPGDVPRDVFVQSLRSLARHGRLLWKMCAQEDGVFLAQARRVQVVEARKGAFLPVEFFYTRRAPREDAPLCAHAAQALQQGLPPESCPAGDDDSVICPTAFWGFHRVIERYAHMRLEGGDEFLLSSEPTRDNGRVEVLGPTLVGMSDKVAPEHRDSLLRQLRELVPSVEQAATWDDWPAKVKRLSPSLLVLLPHSELDPVEVKMATLEIGSRRLLASNLEPEHVRGPGREVGPVVLLLGCRTGLTEVPLQNFVSLFQQSGAALVLGTLSTIRGRHAARFCAQLLAALKACGARPGATFGDVLLEVKQKLLAEGDPFVLTLAAYGDAGWRL